MSLGLLLALAVGAAATPSRSMLGVFVVGDDATAQALLGASPCPRVAVFPLEANGTAAAQIAAYKEHCPGGIAIARVGTPGLAVNGSTVAALGGVWQQELQG